jgi:hypothetical protein
MKKLVVNDSWLQKVGMYGSSGSCPRRKNPVCWYISMAVIENLEEKKLSLWQIVKKM